MKKSRISFEVELDQENIPEKIYWQATDNPSGDKPGETKSISISLWDHEQMNTLRIDLWTKEMTIDEMKSFYVDCIGGLAQSALTATGDEFMANEMNNLCEKFAEYLKRQQSE